MREYPTGMCLLVPPITGQVTHPTTTQGQGPTATILPLPSVPASGVMAGATPQHKVQGTSRGTSTVGADLDHIEVKYDYSRKEIIFVDDRPCPVRNGDWIAVTPAGKFTCP